jgi:hypothetical protein
VHEVEEDGRAPVVSGPEGPEERNGESVHGAEEVASSPCASCGESSGGGLHCYAAKTPARRMMLPRNSHFMESADFSDPPLETAEMRSLWERFSMQPRYHDLSIRRADSLSEPYLLCSVLERAWRR